MPVISALEVHPRRRERVKLYLDGEYAMELPLLELARLETGQELSDTEVDELASLQQYHAAYDRAIRYLAVRPRSCSELRRALQQKKVPAACIDRVMHKLQAQGYADDRAFAHFWLENRKRFKPMAARALRYELRTKGLAHGIIDELLADYDEEDAAYRAAAARSHRFRGRSALHFQQQLGKRLHRRGFSYSTIQSVLLRLQQELEESDSGFFADDAP